MATESERELDQKLNVTDQDAGGATRRGLSSGDGGKGTEGRGGTGRLSGREDRRLKTMKSRLTRVTLSIKFRKTGKKGVRALSQSNESGGLEQTAGKIVQDFFGWMKHTSIWNSRPLRNYEKTRVIASYGKRRATPEKNE